MAPAEYTIPLTPGQLAAIFFIVFDLCMFTMADSFLARLSCIYYYKRIYNGHPIEVTSSNFPFLTSFLLGKFYTPVNLCSTLFKLAIVVILLRLDCDASHPKQKATTTGSFYFSPTSMGSLCGTATRRWSFLETCSDSDNDTLAIYKYVFNLEHPVYVTSDENNEDCISEADLNNIKDSTLKCLGKSKVSEATNSDTQESIDLPQRLAYVIGCSPLRTDGCANSSKETRKFDLMSTQSIESDRAEVMGTWGRTKFYSRALFLRKEALESVWDGYTNTSMVCLLNSFRARGHPSTTVLNSCILSASVEGGTLVEFWEYDNVTKSFNRPNPGPVFDTDFELNPYLKLWLLLQFGRVSKWSWKELAIQVTNRSLRYEAKNITTVSSFGQKTGTSIKKRYLWDAIFAFIVCFILFIITFFLFRHDTRPGFNTVAGMLSILRASYSKTDKRQYVGNAGSIPLSMDKNGQLQFGLVADGENNLRNRSGATTNPVSINGE